MDSRARLLLVLAACGGGGGGSPQGAPPVVSSITPNTSCPQGTSFTIDGSRFADNATVDIGGQAAMLTSITSTEIMGTLGPGLGAGAYDVTVDNGGGRTGSLAAAFTILAPAINAYFVDPEYVYSNVVTPITVYTTGAMQLAAANAIVLTPAGGGSSVDLTATSHVDPSDSDRIFVDIPALLPAGTYALTLADVNGCTMSSTINVVSNTTALTGVVPAFSYDQATARVTVAASGSFFQQGAHAYLIPHGVSSPLAVALVSPIAQTTTQLAATVPDMAALCTSAVPAQPVTCHDGLWDVVVVNRDGTIGLLDNAGAGAFAVEPVPPPQITGIAPGGVVTNCVGGGCNATISGQHFAVTSGSSPPPVTLDCAQAGSTAHSSLVPVVVSASDTAIVVTVPAPVITAGQVCVPTIHNSQGANTMSTTGGTIAIQQPSFNVSTINVGAPLVTARRSPALAANAPSPESHYIYALGGDTGVLDATSHLPSSGFDTVELSRLDPFGGEQPWTTLPTQSTLPVKLTLTTAVSIGSFIYLVGGYDTTAATSLISVWRAQVLQVADAPRVDDTDLALDASNGLDGGMYFYRVAAVMKPNAAVNPGGETLASEEFAVEVPHVQGQKVQVTMSWTSSPALDVDHWRIYRTSSPDAAPGSEDVVFVTADATARFVDRGATLTPFVAGTPQPLGALGPWQAEPSLGVARAGAGVTVVVDPSLPSKAYLYAGFGYDSTSLQFTTTYELLTVDTTTGAPTGSWSSPGSIMANSITTDVGRWLAGAYAITPDVDSAACPVTGACQAYVAFGPGAATVAQEAAGANGVGSTDIAEVAAGSGTLSFGTAGPANKQYGYGSITATNWIFQVGGGGGGGATNKLNAATITSAATTTGTPAFGSSYAPQGTGTLTIGGASAPRFLPGSVLAEPFIVTVGGAATIGGGAVADSFYGVY
jgi:hypothetical protein